MNEECKQNELPVGPWTIDIVQHPAVDHAFFFLGLPCVLRRAGGWTWDCFVHVPPNHPWGQNIQYTDVVDLVNIHGGLTFGPGNGVFGFRTNHRALGDLVPSDAYIMPGMNCAQRPPAEGIVTKYWTYTDAMDEVKQLAAQLVAIQNKRNGRKRRFQRPVPPPLPPPPPLLSVVADPVLSVPTAHDMDEP